MSVLKEEDKKINSGLNSEQTLSIDSFNEFKPPDISSLKMGLKALLYLFKQKEGIKTAD